MRSTLMMNIRLTAHKAFAILIIAFILHNIEEAIFICRYPVDITFSFFQPPSSSQFLWAVSILTVVGIFAYVFALQTKKAAVYLFISTALAASLLFNVFVPHVIVAIYTMHYTPGLLSAVMLNLPVSLIVMTKNRKLINTNAQFVKQVISGLAISYIVFVLVMLLVLHLA